MFDGAEEATALEALRLQYRIIAAELLDVGIDVNCAPLADVLAPETHEIIGTRALGHRPDDVVRRARAVMDWGARARQALRSLAGQRISKKIEMRVIAPLP